MAAKSVQPATLTCRRPPGSRPSHGDRPRNRSWLRRVRNRNSPIQLNMGSAVSVQGELVVQVVVTRAGTAGREVKVCMRTRATPSNERPTQIPLPRQEKRDARKTTNRQRCIKGGG